MERETEKIIVELEKEIIIWKESQAIHTDDIDYFHYSQWRIDGLEAELNRISRMENEDGHL